MCTLIIKLNSIQFKGEYIDGKIVLRESGLQSLLSKQV